jgi:hypothetical protein
MKKLFNHDEAKNNCYISHLDLGASYGRKRLIVIVFVKAFMEQAPK